MSTYMRGQFVSLTYNGVTIDAMVMLVSPNGHSLMLGFDGTLRTRSGGLVFGSLPLLLDETGVYRDLVENEPAFLEPRVVQ